MILVLGHFNPDVCEARYGFVVFALVLVAQYAYSHQIPAADKFRLWGRGCFDRIAPLIFLLKGVLFMTTVRVKENEPFEVAMRRFKRSVEKTGLLTELRAREFYEKPTAERKRKLAAAVKRHYKRLRSQVLPPKMY